MGNVIDDVFQNPRKDLFQYNWNFCKTFSLASIEQRNYGNKLAWSEFERHPNLLSNKVRTMNASVNVDNISRLGQPITAKRWLKILNFKKSINQELGIWRRWSFLKLSQEYLRSDCLTCSIRDTTSGRDRWPVFLTSGLYLNTWILGRPSLQTVLTTAHIAG